MNGISTIHDIQKFAVVDEYRKAVEDKATEKAANIRTANPDCVTEFDGIDRLVG